MNKKKKYYAIVRGHKPGIYTQWYGEDGAQVQTTNFPNAFYKGFFSFEDAEEWMKSQGNPALRKKETEICSESDKISRSKSSLKGSRGIAESHAFPVPKAEIAAIRRERSEAVFDLLKIIIYTDGGCSHNPGPGGYGVVLSYGKHRKEISGGFRLTTNNRMELMACIVGLESLKKCSAVILFSDSRYVVDGMTKGWAKRWQANGWMRNRIEKAVNADLWEKLLDLCAGHAVAFRWVKGHAGHAENERCDHLAGQMLSQPDLPPDIFYEDHKGIK